MRSFVKPGNTITLTAPTGGVTAGLGYKIGQLFVIAVTTAAAAASFEGMVTGVHSLPKTTSQAWTEGQLLYWNSTTAKASSDGSVGPLIGVAVAAAGSSDTTGSIRLDGISSDVIAVAEGSPTPTSKATATAVTLTAAEVLTGIVVADPAGGACTYTFPTAALLVAAVPNAKVGDLLWLKMINGADASEVITLAAGSGGGFDTNQTSASRVIGQNNSKQVAIRLTNVTAASEAYVIYA